MAQQVINIGAAPNDGTGDQLRTAFDKCNENFVEVYAGAGGKSQGLWNYNQTDTDTATAPVSGRFKTNSGNYRDATQIAIHATTIQGIDRANTLRTLQVNDIIQCQDSLDGDAWCRYDLRSPPIDNGTWFQLDVALQVDGGVASGDNQEIVFIFTANNIGAASGSAEYRFSTTTTPPPASGYVRANNATAASITLLYVNNITNGGTDIKRSLTTLPVGTEIVIQERDNSNNYAQFTISATVVDQTTYVDIPVTFVIGGGTLGNNNIILFNIRGSGGGGAGGNVSNSGTPVAGQAAEWVTATTIKGVSAPTPHCGRLAYIGATQLTFLPFNGDKIKINGVIYTIPGTGAGIAGLANTGVRVNNVPGSSLAANTTYWVFAENVSGTITGHFWTQAGGLNPPHHRPSQTAGNEGLETWYNGTELPQFTLIGLVRTNASSQFVDSAAVRGVLSWFNRRPRVAQGKFTVDRATGSTTFVEINSEIAIGFLTWADSAVLLHATGYTWNSTAGAGGATKIYVDGTATTGRSIFTSPAANYVAGMGMTAALGGLDPFTEGYHSATLYGLTSAGIQAWAGSDSCSLTANIMG